MLLVMILQGHIHNHVLHRSQYAWLLHNNAQTTMTTFTTQEPLWNVVERKERMCFYFSMQVSHRECVFFWIERIMHISINTCE